ncbi:MAG: PcfJ domain-containing protein [Clostridium tyrobutyricum]|jgi:DNA-directed RNA polymerase subunit RPC12/RpoP|nr:PcfJ domain-containing protein [Clostridium tyrobutyricum]
MLKKELLKIKIETKIKIADIIINSDKMSLLKTDIRKIKGEKILIVGIYILKNNTADLKYIVYFNKKHEYITRDFCKNKWRTASLKYLIDYRYINYNVMAASSSAKNILDYFKLDLNENNLNNVNVLEELSLVQQNKLAERLQNKYKKIKNDIDQKMALVPKLPKSFSKWVDEKALYKSRYIYYKYENKKQVTGYCTHCKHDITVKRHKHNEPGICPNCGSKVVFKSLGKSTNLVDHMNVSIIQKIENGYVVRYFDVYKYYYDYRKTNIDIWEITREFHFKDNIEFFEWGLFSQTGETRWVYPTNFNSHDISSTVLYTKNLGYITKNVLELQYSQISKASKQLIKNDILFNVYTYIYLYKHFPFIEYIVKENLFNLLNDLISLSNFSGTYSINRYFDINEKSIFKILKLDRTWLNIFKEFNGNLNMLKLLQNLKAHKINTSTENILFMSKFILDYNFNNLVNILQYCSINKALKYIKVQKLWKKYNRTDSNLWGEMYVDQNLQNLLNNWNDYLINVNKLGLNLKSDFTLFPKNLPEKHDQAYKLVVKKKEKEYDKNIKNQYLSKLEKYSWNYKNYVICIPKNALEIIQEGEILHHCVGSYVSRVAKVETTILFLREKSNIERPFFTLEVKGSNIIQCFGIKDSYPPKEIKNVLEMFKQQKLTKYEIAV